MFTNKQINKNQTTIKNKLVFIYETYFITVDTYAVKNGYIYVCTVGELKDLTLNRACGVKLP